MVENGGDGINEQTTYEFVTYGHDIGQANFPNGISSYVAQQGIVQIPTGLPRGAKFISKTIGLKANTMTAEGHAYYQVGGPPPGLREPNHPNLGINPSLRRAPPAQAVNGPREFPYNGDQQVPNIEELGVMEAM